MLQNWQPRDLIALIALIGALALRAIGINSITEWIIVAVTVGYLGLSAPRLRR